MRKPIPFCRYRFPVQCARRTSNSFRTPSGQCVGSVLIPFLPWARAAGRGKISWIASLLPGSHAARGLGQPGCVGDKKGSRPGTAGDASLSELRSFRTAHLYRKSFEAAQTDPELKKPSVPQRRIENVLPPALSRLFLLCGFFYSAISLTVSFAVSFSRAAGNISLDAGHLDAAQDLSQVSPS